LAKSSQELKGLADIVAISVDLPLESRKTDQLLDRAFPLLGDPDLKVINSYGMQHDMGSETIGNMGYVIIDAEGKLRKKQVDPLFGAHADDIINELRNL